MASSCCYCAVRSSFGGGRTLPGVPPSQRSHTTNSTQPQIYPLGNHPKPLCQLRPVLRFPINSASVTNSPSRFRSYAPSSSLYSDIGTSGLIKDAPVGLPGFVPRSANSFSDRLKFTPYAASATLSSPPIVSRRSANRLVQRTILPRRLGRGIHHVRIADGF
jgi:hypothetical protein